MAPEVVALRRRMAALTSKSGITSEQGGFLAGHRVVEDTAEGNEDDGSEGASYVSESSTSPDRSGGSKSPSLSRPDHPQTTTPESHATNRSTTPLLRQSSRMRRMSQTSAERQAESASWFSFDLSIVVALISPIGNWLTGGDHIKNVLLILLLIFYLHQLIEVPWSLYRASIPRIDVTEDLNNPQAEQLFLSAHAELRSLELVYLLLSVLAPFFGALLLRSVSHAITGNADTLSWFSTALFVLATGVRPWMHLVSRLKSRSEALNDILISEYPKEAAQEAEELGLVEEALADIRENMADLEAKLGRLNGRTHREVDVLHDRMQDVVDRVGKLEKLMQKHQRESNKTMITQNSRLHALEVQLSSPAYLTIVHKNERSGWGAFLSKLPSSFLYYLDALPAYFRGGSSSAPSSPVLDRHRRTPSKGSNSLNLTLAPIPEEQHAPSTSIDGLPQQSLVAPPVSPPISVVSSTSTLTNYPLPASSSPSPRGTTSIRTAAHKLQAVALFPFRLILRVIWLSVIGIPLYAFRASLHALTHIR